MAKKLIITGANFASNAITDEDGAFVIVMGKEYAQECYFDSSTNKLVSASGYFTAVLPLPSGAGEVRIKGLTPIASTRALRFSTNAPTTTVAASLVSTVPVNQYSDTGHITIPSGANYVFLTLQSPYDNYYDYNTATFLFYPETE